MKNVFIYWPFEIYSKSAIKSNKMNDKLLQAEYWNILRAIHLHNTKTQQQQNTNGTIKDRCDRCT